MKPFSNVLLCASFGLTILAFGCAEMNSGKSDSTGSSTAPASSTSPAASASKGNGASAPSDATRVSSGTQGDTLDACLARIPSNASSGQRMLATMSCERDANTRTSIDAVPGK